VARPSPAELLLTWWGAHSLRAIIFDLDPREPWLFAVVALILIVTTIVAAWLPARRAARTDPAIVLRTS
jgi:ABC-type lipoprotein release transport system permease subunit